MPLDLVIGERLVGCTLVLTRDGTPSRQNLGPSRPQRIDFVLCNLGMLRQLVSRGTHWFTSKIEILQLVTNCYPMARSLETNWMRVLQKRR